MTVGQGSPQVERIAARHTLIRVRRMSIPAAIRWPQFALLWILLLNTLIPAVVPNFVPQVRAQDPLDNTLRETNTNASLNTSTNFPPATSALNGPTPSTTNLTKSAIELRIVWGGGTPRTFAGEITIDSGTIELVRNLSVQSDAIGSISNADLRTLKLQAHAPSSFGGCDLKIDAAPESRLTFRFPHSGTGQIVEQSLTLDEAMQLPWQKPIDEQGNVVAVERLVYDRLRVQPLQTSGMYEVGSKWQGNISGYRTGLQAGDYDLVINLLSPSQGDSVLATQSQNVSIDAQGGFRSTNVEVELPKSEGAYAVEFMLRRKRMLPSFVAAKSNVTRRVDLIAFDAAAQPSRIGSWVSVAKIEPLESRWWSPLNWLTSLSAVQPMVKLPTFAEQAKRPVSYGTQSQTRIGEQPCLVLGANSWQSYPLQIEHAGNPHRVRVRVPRDRTQQLVISIRDFHANGEPTTLNVDSGLVISERQIENTLPNSEAWIEQEVIFWPRSTQPHLLLLNPSSDSESAFGTIQLEAATLEPMPKATSTPPSSTTEVKEARPETRTVALYLSRPFLADAFGAQRSIDPVTQRPLDTWNTWQQAAERLTLYMQSAGYNTLVLTSLNDGGAIFPLKRLQSTMRYDSGTYFSDGRSTEIKDFVELLCRHFDRCGLKLVLSLDLNSPLPGLVKWELDPNKNAALYQIGIDGKPWKADTDAANRRVLYNPLHPQVQAEITQIIREVGTRYAKHPSFRGLQLELTPASHLVFAGDRWGYDDVTLKQFAAATQAKLPPRDQGLTQFQGALRLAFLNWRARELSNFYASLAETLRAAKPDAKLLLNTVALHQSQPSQHAFQDPVAVTRNLSEVLLATGIDVGTLRQNPTISLLRGQSDSPLSSDVERDWLSRVANDPGLATMMLGPSLGVVQLHKPIGIQIPEIAKLLAASSANAASQANASWCYPIVASSEERARRGIIEQLYREDSAVILEGTWMPPQTNSAYTAELRRTLTELPAAPMQSIKIDGNDTNLRLRSARINNDTYLQLINNASWPERVTMDVKIAAIRGVVEVLGGKQLELHPAEVSPAAASKSDEGAKRVSTIWQFDLQPYDIVAIKVSDPQFKLNGIIHSPDASVIEKVEGEVNAIEARLSQLNNASRTEPLAVVGGDFERWIDDGRPEGWTTSSLPQVTIRQENALPHTGSYCVAIENRNQAQVSAWLQSEPIQVPESGRIVVQAWLRTSLATALPKNMRISLVGRLRDGRRYQRTLQINPQSGTDLAIDWGKRPVMMFVTDLPSADLTELRIAFDLVGPGKVWLDDVQAFEAMLSPDEYAQFRSQIFLAKEKLRESNAFAGEQLMNSYLVRYLTSLEPRPTLSTMAPKQTIAPEKSSAPSRWNNSPHPLQQLRESMRERWSR